MKNVNSEGKFVLPVCPQERDVAELVVFIVARSPELKLEAVRGNGVLTRSFDAFVTSCMSAGVSFEHCLPEILGGFLIEATRPKRGFIRHGHKMSRKGRREITFDLRVASKILSGELR